MDKNAIKTFAIESRRKMIKSVKFQASMLGITADEIKDPISKGDGMETYDYGAGQHIIYDEDIKKRESLVREINNKGFENVVEEVAYTWFNRIIAIRYMEVNDYLPTRTRVLSSETEGKLEPDIITEALDLDLDFTEEDREKILKFKLDNENDKLFQFLFIKQCNKLNEILPGLFEKTDDYMELLFDIKFTDEDSVVRQLVNNISEEDFYEEIEIIGWLYQFYNIELKEETFSNLSKGKKIDKNNLPAATQLFTPEWIVKYMVDNSLGRLWIEGHQYSNIKKYCIYYIDDNQQNEDVEIELSDIKENSKNINIENLMVIDPCMGSGHIMVYVFDVLMEIYTSIGYSNKEATISILENNLYGLDIDDRAYQMSYFSIMMKARSYNRGVFAENITPHIFSIQESNNFNESFIDLFAHKPEVLNEFNELRSIFFDAKLYGSMINVNQHFLKLKEFINDLENRSNNNLSLLSFLYDIKLVKSLLNQANILNQKFDVVVTNPPYMGNKNINTDLKKFLEKNYKEYKADLFAAFIKRCHLFLKENSYVSMITQQTFMFLNSFKDMRPEFLNKNIINLIQLGSRAFEEIEGEVVQTVAFVQRNTNIPNFLSTFVKLTDYNNPLVKEEEFFNKENYFLNYQENFSLIRNSPIAYWANEKIYNHFKFCDKLSDYVDYTGSFHKTADNNKYLRYFWEIDYSKKDLWKHYNKGGRARKWYGNNELLVNWSPSSIDFYKNHKTANLFKEDFWYREGITWTALTSNVFNARYFGKGFISDFKGASIYPKENLFYILGYLNSSVYYYFIKLLVPNMDFNVGQVVDVPFIYESNEKIEKMVEENVFISIQNYDESELSYDFKYNSLIDKNCKNYFIKNQISILEDNFNNDFSTLKNNEEEINKYFINLFDLNDFISPNVDENNIFLFRFDLKEKILDFISYAVGCMFGRYSLDEEGLQFAGGEFNINNYSKFIPDDDNIVPVLDTEYFNDDIVGRFVEFVKVCFGEETLEENLDFIAGALKKKGKTSREIIRNYFLTDFFKDHAQTYKKCPIYWQFDSGKQNAFKCLIYMHRYEPGLVARVRTDYLHKTQKAIEQNLSQCESIIANSSNKSEVSKATKDKSKYIKQLDEIKVYDEALAHIANQQIEIDLDDGVKVNHAKFQNVEISKEGQKAKKIDLLKKI